MKKVSIALGTVMAFLAVPAMAEPGDGSEKLEAIHSEMMDQEINGKAQPRALGFQGPLDNSYDSAYLEKMHKSMYGQTSGK